MSLPSRAQLILIMIMVASPSHQIQDPALIDRTVRDSAFQSYPKHHRKTATLYKVLLPPSLSGVAADVTRFRAGSLRRYGAEVKEFHILPGLVVHPHTKRLIVVRQNLGHFSSIYNGYLNRSGFQLISPVVGLSIYDAAILTNSSVDPSELKILITKEPIIVDFSGIVRPSQGSKLVCAVFGLDGTVSISNHTSYNVCYVQRQGHFALVIESSTLVRENNKASGWKVVAAGVAAGAFGGALLGMMVVAIVNVKKKRRQMAEMERRAHEEEALQLCMVGHVMAPTASVSRTAPTLENDYAHSL